VRPLAVLALLLASGLPRHWAEINSDTNQIAQDKLNTLQREGGEGRSASVFKSAHLDEPFYYYANDDNFASFAADSSNDLLPYLAWREAMYPVVSGNDAIGVLMIKDSGGGPHGYFIPVPEGIYARVKDALRRVRLDGDQRLSVASTSGGDYFLIEDGETIYKMAPCTTRTLLMLGLNDQHVEDLRFVTPKEMGPMIKRAMRGEE
jgi:hypothetical protein